MERMPAVATVKEGEFPMIRSRKDLARYRAEDLAAHKLSRWRWSDRFRYPIVAYQRRLRHTEWVFKPQTCGTLVEDVSDVLPVAVVGGRNEDGIGYSA